MTDNFTGLLKFSAEWCAPCRAAAPLIKEAADEVKAELMSVDIDKSPEIAEKFGVRTIPMIVAMKNGEPLDVQVGSADRERYMEMGKKTLE
jgi:thioredoxin 1